MNANERVKNKTGVYFNFIRAWHLDSLSYILINPKQIACAKFGSTTSCSEVCWLDLAVGVRIAIAANEEQLAGALYHAENGQFDSSLDVRDY